MSACVFTDFNLLAADHTDQSPTLFSHIVCRSPRCTSILQIFVAIFLLDSKLLLEGGNHFSLINSFTSFIFTPGGHVGWFHMTSCLGMFPLSGQVIDELSPRGWPAWGKHRQKRMWARLQVCTWSRSCTYIQSTMLTHTRAQHGINRRKLRTLEAQNTAGESPVVDVRVADGREGGNGEEVERMKEKRGGWREDKT